MYSHRRIFVDPSGQPHTIQMAHTEGWWQIDDEPIQHGPPAVAVDFGKTSLGWWVLLADWNPEGIGDGRTVLVCPIGPPLVIALGQGAYGQALRIVGERVEVYVRRDNVNDSTFVDVFEIVSDFGGSSAVWNRRYMVPYAPQIHHIDPDGYPVTEVDPLRRSPRVVGGLLLFNIDEHNGHVVGHPQDPGDFDGQPKNAVVLVKPDGSKWMAPYETDQTPGNPRVFAEGDELMIAMTNENTPDPRQVYLQLERWKPWVAPVEPLPVMVLRDKRPRWIVDTSGVLSGNGISTTAHNVGPLFEDALWVPTEREKDLEALYFGPEPPRFGTRDEYAEATVAMALRNRVPVFVCDEWGEASKGWRDRFRGRGCAVIDGLELYRGLTESREDFRQRTRHRLTNAERPYGIVRPESAPIAGGSELEAAHTLLIIDEETAAQPDPPVLEDCFGLDRPPLSDWRRNYLAAVISHVPKPTSLRQPAPTQPSQPVPPVVFPPADQPVVKKKKRFRPS